MTLFILAEGRKIVNASADFKHLLPPMPPMDTNGNLAIKEFLLFLPQGFSAIIDRARHLHKFPKTI